MTKGSQSDVGEQVTQSHLRSHAGSQSLSTSQQLPSLAHMKTDNAVSSIYLVILELSRRNLGSDFQLYLSCGHHREEISVEYPWKVPSLVTML